MIRHRPARPLLQARQVGFPADQSRPRSRSSIDHLVPIDGNHFPNRGDDSFAKERRRLTKFVKIIPGGIHILVEIQKEKKTTAFHKPPHQLRFGTNHGITKLAIDVAALRIAALIAFPTIGIDARQDEPVHAPFRPFPALQPAECAFDTTWFFAVNPRGNQYCLRVSADFALHAVEWITPDPAGLLYSSLATRQYLQPLYDLAVITNAAHAPQLSHTVLVVTTVARSWRAADFTPSP